MKYLGAAYLVYLGGRIVLNTWRERGASPTAKGERTSIVPSFARRFTEAFLVSAGNPKTVVFLAAFLPQFVVSSEPLAIQFAEMFLTIAAIVLVVHAAYAWIAVSVRRRVFDTRVRRGTSYASGDLFMALGVGLSTS